MAKKKKKQVSGSGGRSRKEVFVSVKEATVAIGTTRAVKGGIEPLIVGSGFNVAPEGIIITAAHVLNEFMTAFGPSQPLAPSFLHTRGLMDRNSARFGR
jgi:hypothetical protein